eukprot:TRINITY_DN718_c0_g1_i2.p1 TRINITY_DN718_c0_g1~~TRINITY_DN718_c0_g1_i2.p1  ORF type:complete len:574 (-),score=46.59 TRINITY_DN718_c0_g1_i2:258-1979(-)
MALLGYLLLLVVMQAAAVDDSLFESRPPHLPHNRAVLQYDEESLTLERDARSLADEVLLAARDWSPLPNRQINAYGSAPHSYVRYSAYRYDLSTFLVVGITFIIGKPNLDLSVPIKERENQVAACVWLPRRAEQFAEEQQRWRDEEDTASVGVVVGEASGHVTTAGQRDVDQYHPLQVTCAFSTSVGLGDPLQGGHLALVFKQLPSSDSSASRVLLVYSETNVNPDLYSSADPLRNPPSSVNFVHCFSPMTGKISPNRIATYLSFHSLVYERSVEYVIYNGGSIEKDPELAEVVEYFVGEGLASVINIHEPLREFKSHRNRHQKMALFDCVNANRYKARWVVNLDYDEYITMKPPMTLTSLVEQHQDAYAISLGYYLYSSTQCFRCGRYKTSPWAMELMPFRRTVAHCRNMSMRGMETVCFGKGGTRKLLINPVVVVFPDVHVATPVVPIRAIEQQYSNMDWRKKSTSLQDNGASTIYRMEVVDTREAWMAHFRWFVGKALRLCRVFHSLDETKVDDKFNRFDQTDYVVDTTLRDYIRDNRRRLDPTLRKRLDKYLGVRCHYGEFPRIEYLTK